MLIKVCNFRFNDSRVVVEITRSSNVHRHDVLTKDFDDACLQKRIVFINMVKVTKVDSSEEGKGFVSICFTFLQPMCLFENLCRRVPRCLTICAYSLYAIVCNPVDYRSVLCNNVIIQTL